MALIIPVWCRSVHSRDHQITFASRLSNTVMSETAASSGGIRFMSFPVLRIHLMEWTGTNTARIVVLRWVMSPMEHPIQLCLARPSPGMLMLAPDIRSTGRECIFAKPNGSQRITKTWQPCVVWPASRQSFTAIHITLHREDVRHTRMLVRPTSRRAFGIRKSNFKFGAGIQKQVNRHPARTPAVCLSRLWTAAYDLLRIKLTNKPGWPWGREMAEKWFPRNRIFSRSTEPSDTDDGLVPLGNDRDGI